MNEVLLRRLLGALVLLTVAFAVASLLPRPQRSAVSGADADESERQVVRYDLQNGGPVGLKLDPELQTPAVTPVLVPAPKADPATPAAVSKSEAPKPEASKPATPRPAPAAWSIQVGSFADPVNAHGVRDRLEAEKLAATVQEVKVGSVKWYRVRVGPFRDEAGARKALERVRKLDLRGAHVVED